jgi:hypothetical protein
VPCHIADEIVSWHVDITFLERRRFEFWVGRRRKEEATTDDDSR